jgi:hypothetical protein
MSLIDPTTGLAPNDSSPLPMRQPPIGAPSLGTAGPSTLPRPVAPPPIGPPSTTTPPIYRSTLPNTPSTPIGPPSTQSTAPPSSSTTTLPPLPSQYALQLIKGGKTPQDAITATNSAYNLQTGAQGVYYPGTNTVGFNDGFYLAGPTFQNGMSDWGSVMRGNESAPAAGGNNSDLMGMLTQLLGSVNKAPTNTIAALPPPANPGVTPASSSTASAFPGMAVNPITGLPYGLTVNPATGLMSVSDTSPTGLNAPSLPGGPTSTTQSTPGQGAIRDPATGQITTTNTPVVPPGADQPSAGFTGAGFAPPIAPEPPPGTGSRTPQPVLVGTIDPATGLVVSHPYQGGPGGPAGGPPGSGNPFSDPTQMALWEAVQAALAQVQAPVGNNPQTAALYQAIAQMAKNLSGPAFSDAQLNQIRTASLDSIQADQDNAVQAEITRLGLLGQSPTSGTVTDAVNKIKASYTTLKGQAQQASNMYELNTVAQRQQELLQTLNLGATTATTNQQLGTQNAVTGAELSTLPVSAENTALQNAATLAQANSPSAIIQSFIPWLQFNLESGQINAQNASQIWQYIGKVFPMLFPSTTGGG